MASRRLAPEVNRILFVQNLPFQTTGNELYKLFSKHGAIRQIRIGVTKQTRGTAFVIFENILDAQRALESMKGFKVGERYITVLYFSSSKTSTNASEMGGEGTVSGLNLLGEKQTSHQRKSKLHL